MSASVQQLLERLRTGDDSALAELTPTLYNELRHIASCHMRGERSDHTLQPTALVHEAWLKIFDGSERRFTRDATKEVHVVRREVKSGEGLELVALIGDAMQELAAESETVARVMDMHYFGGLTAEEMAEPPDDRCTRRATTCATRRRGCGGDCPERDVLAGNIGGAWRCAHPGSVSQDCGRLHRMP